MSYINITSAQGQGRVIVTNGPIPSPSQGQWLGARDNYYQDLPVADVANPIASVGVTWENSSVPGWWTSSISRYFMAFDSGSVPTQVTSLTLYIYCPSTTGQNIMVVGSSAPTTSTNISAANYKSIPGLLDQATMNSYAVNVYTADISTPPYTGPVPSPSPFQPNTGWNAIPLNALAVTNFNAGSQFQIAIVDYDYDYLYVIPPAGTVLWTEIAINNGSASYPYLVATTAQGQWVLSINPAVTNKVNTVPEANINLVNRTGITPIFRWDTGGTGGGTNPGCAIGAAPYIPIYTQLGIFAPNGAIVYIDAALTTTFNGGNLYWSVDPVANNPSYSAFGRQWQISATGVIVNTSQTCNIP